MFNQAANEINTFEYKNPNRLSNIFIALFLGAIIICFAFSGLAFRFIYSYYKYLLGIALFFWTKQVLGNSWVFIKRGIPYSPKALIFYLFMPILQYITGFKLIMTIWQCSSETATTDNWKKEKTSIFFPLLIILSIIISLIAYYELREAEFVFENIYFNSVFLKDHFIPWGTAICFAMCIYIVRTISIRQQQKYEYILTTSPEEFQEVITISDEEIKNSIEKPQIGEKVTSENAVPDQKLMRSRFFLIRISIWLHIIFLTIITAMAFQKIKPDEYDMVGLSIFFLLSILLLFSLSWIAGTFTVNHELKIINKPTKPFHTLFGLLIPGLNLFYPFLKLMQFWKASDADSTSENWKEASPNYFLIANWFGVVVFTGLTVAIVIKNFVFSKSDITIMFITIIYSLITIIVFMFQFQKRQKNKAIQLGVFLDNNNKNTAPTNTEPGYFQKLD